MASNYPTALPQASAPFVDLATGKLTITGYRFCSDLWNRTGGAQGSNSTAVLQSANNLSDVASAALSRQHLGLGTAATQDSTAFATAAQGTDAVTALGLAQTALQPNTAITVTTATAGNVEIGGSAMTISGLQVVGARITGWGTPSGGVAGSGAAYGGQTIGATYSQTQVQATDDAVKSLSEKFIALVAALQTHGLIAT